MASLSHIKREAKEVADKTENVALKKLAEAVEQLATYVDDVERKAKETADNVAQAKRDAES